MADETEQAYVRSNFPAVLKQIRADVKGSTISDAPSTSQEVQRLQMEEYEERIEGLKQDREERKKYAFRYYALTVGWLLAVLALLALNQKLCLGLGENVLLMLLAEVPSSFPPLAGANSLTLQGLTAFLRLQAPCCVPM